MPKLIFLGSSNAIPAMDHENTHMVLVGSDKVVLIDTGHNPIIRLQQAGITYNQVTDLILTHFHPDHVSGVPSFLMSSWLMGRKDPLKIYGLEYTLERTRKLMEFHDWTTWPNFYSVEFITVPEREMATLLTGSEFNIYSSPVHHFVPTIGLRIEFRNSHKVFAYSCDTAPCAEVVRLGMRADILVHEAAGAAAGHTSAAQAGEIAREAGVRELYLIHYRTWNYDPSVLVKEAEDTFGGPVTLACDFMEIEYK